MTNAVPARRLGALLEPPMGQVYFSPESHAAHEKLGFGAATPAAGGLALPNDVRGRIEERTDHAMCDAIAAIGDDFAELDALLAPWGAAVRAARGYPPSGPHDIGGSRR